MPITPQAKAMGALPKPPKPPLPPMPSEEDEPKGLRQRLLPFADDAVMALVNFLKSRSA